MYIWFPANFCFDYFLSLTALVTAVGCMLGWSWKGSSLKWCLQGAIMVRLTVDLIAKSRNHFKKKRGLSLAEYLRTLTHLHFSNKSIEDIVSTHFLAH